jgi:hypothetical protein
MYYKAQQTDKTMYYIIAAISGIYASYCKEPVFGALLIVALTNIIFRFKQMTRKDKTFNIVLVVNATAFVILYYFLSFRNANGEFYGSGRIVTNSQVLMRIFLGTKILIPIFILGFIRIFFMLVKNDRTHIYYDSLLFASMGYVIAYFILNMYYGYYLVPAVILATPSFVYWITYLYRRKIIITFFLLFSLTLMCGFNFYTITKDVKNILQDRQEFMPYIYNLLDEYNSDRKFIWYESDKTFTNDTSNKAVRTWKQSILIQFLNYANNTTDKEFFTATNNIKQNEAWDSNFLFFYPTNNDQEQPMPDELVNWLQENGCVLYSDLYDILIYRIP